MGYNQMILQHWSYVGIIERLKVNDIVFCLSVFEKGWYERLWTCIYKGVKVKRVNGNANSFLCVWEKKSLEILNQMKQIVVLKYWINNVTKIIFKHWTKGNKESLFLNLFLSLMWLKGILIIFIECAIWQNLMISCMRSLLLYILVFNPRNARDHFTY